MATYTLKRKTFTVAVGDPSSINVLDNLAGNLESLNKRGRGVAVHAFGTDFATTQGFQDYLTKNNLSYDAASGFSTKVPNTSAIIKSTATSPIPKTTPKFKIGTAGKVGLAGLGVLGAYGIGKSIFGNKEK